MLRSLFLVALVLAVYEVQAASFWKASPEDNSRLEKIVDSLDLKDKEKAEEQLASLETRGVQAASFWRASPEDNSRLEKNIDSVDLKDKEKAAEQLAPLETRGVQAASFWRASPEDNSRLEKNIDSVDLKDNEEAAEQLVPLETRALEDNADKELDINQSNLDDIPDEKSPKFDPPTERDFEEFENLLEEGHDDNDIRE